MPQNGAMSVPAPPGLPLDRLLTPVAWTDAHARIEGCNAAFARWLGISARRLLDQPLAALEADGDVLRRALAEADPDSDQLRLRRIELAFLGGASRFADGWLSRREDGGWLLEAHPVDEFPGDDPLQVLPSALSAALRGLAHELRNPLAGLKGAAQLLRRRIDDADAAELLELIQSEVARLTQLVDNLLAPLPPNAHAPLNIHVVLERVVSLAEAEAGWIVKLTRDYDPSLPDLSGDLDRLVQATWNLVRNAIQAGAANVALRTRIEHGVRIGDVAHARALRLEISDDGRGVPEELAEQIFLPLVSGRADGTGLGLALAQQVAREHRGSLAYRSRAGHTVFTLLLPLDADEHTPGLKEANDG